VSRLNYLRLLDLISDNLLASVQTHAEDDGCGDITEAFIDHAAASLADVLLERTGVQL